MCARVTSSTPEDPMGRDYTHRRFPKGTHDRPSRRASRSGTGRAAREWGESPGKYGNQAVAGGD